MSKGKDFRGPRKRGFDDDGPSFDAPRRFAPQRPAFDRPPIGGGFGGDFAGGPSAAPVTGNTVDAVVKWFKGDKGFGFVE
jgi:CspA family cold shock protein